MAGHFSDDSGMATYLLRSLRHPTATIKTPHDLEKLYEARVWFPLNDLDVVTDEILHLIDLLPSQENYVDAVIAVKFYIISWCTLSDILAKLINKIFDLGIDEKDINLMMLFRNEHVKASGLPGILKKYALKIRHEDFSTLRNDIIHRGILKDPDLESIRDRLARLKLLRLFGPSDADAEAEAIRLDLQNYLLQKQSEFTQHLQATIALLDEMIAYLQPIVENKITLARGDKKGNVKQVRQIKPA